MTTGRGLSASRLSATCVLFLRADYGQWAKESGDDERTPPAQVGAHETARPEPTLPTRRKPPAGSRKFVLVFL